MKTIKTQKQQKATKIIFFLSVFLFATLTGFAQGHHTHDHAHGFEVFDGKNNDATMRLMTAPNQKGRWKRFNVDGPLAFWTDFKATENDSPQFRIDMNGDINITGDILKNGKPYQFGRSNHLYEGINQDLVLDLEYRPDKWTRIISSGALGFWANGKGAKDNSPQMILNMSGNLAIGKKDAGHKLDVAGSINFTGDLFKNGKPYVAHPFITGKLGDHGLYMSKDAWNNGLLINFFGEYGDWKRINSNGPLAFWANGKGNEDWAPQMHLNMSGNLAIGKKYADHRLDVVGNINFTGDLYKNGKPYVAHPFITGKLGDDGLHIGMSDTKGLLINLVNKDGNLNGINSYGPLAFWANGKGNDSWLPQMRLNKNGDLAIGKSFPQHRLDVDGDINFTGDLLKNGVLYAANSSAQSFVKLGKDAGKGITETKTTSHVFIGNGAGSKKSFDDIRIIDYADKESIHPISGTDYLTDNSVFVLNNKSDLEKPLLFGNFSKPGDPKSMAQISINTHHVMDSVALTVSGAVHIGRKNMDPKAFPSKTGYKDALLWVEKGIVTENVTYSFISDWNNWPDFVFDKEYDLMDLNDLESYIKKEKHLPGIASREEVKENGLKSREMFVSLLLKIEELTLYTIDQEKKIETQQKLNQTLLNRLSAIENQLNK
jgi:hypothetical protein